MEVRVKEGRAVNIHMFCARRPGLLLSTMRALDNLGLDIQQAVISCFNGFALDVFQAEVHFFPLFLSSSASGHFHVKISFNLDIYPTYYICSSHMIATNISVTIRMNLVALQTKPTPVQNPRPQKEFISCV